MKLSEAVGHVNTSTHRNFMRLSQFLQLLIYGCLYVHCTDTLLVTYHVTSWRWTHTELPKCLAFSLEQIVREDFHSTMQNVYLEGLNRYSRGLSSSPCRINESYISQNVECATPPSSLEQNWTTTQQPSPGDDWSCHLLHTRIFLFRLLCSEIAVCSKHSR
jgi:hypothetical protein